MVTFSPVQRAVLLTLLIFLLSGCYTSPPPLATSNDNIENNDTADGHPQDRTQTAPEKDSDRDTIPDHRDNCPTVPNRDQKDSNANGKGDACEVVCGDGIVSPGENCDPKVPLSQTCKSYGYTSGTLQCRNCRFDFSRCVRPPIQIYRRRRGSCPYIYLKKEGVFHYHGDTSGSVLGYGLSFFKPKYYGENIYSLGDFSSEAGTYQMLLREVIFESAFIDTAALYVVDVPRGYSVLNRWSFTSQLNQFPQLGFLTVKNMRPPRSAVLENGSDVLRQISHADGVPLPVAKNGLSRVILDFGPLKNPAQAKLILSAWGYYADLKRHQKPPFSAGTTIEVRREGKWVTKLVTGKAAGDLKTWVVPLGGILRRNNSKIRLTMAHQPSVIDILDAVALDDSPQAPMVVRKILPTRARLTYGGSARVSPSSRTRRISADNSRQPLEKDAYMKGHFTRYGTVKSLLASRDDRFVIMAHGDRLELTFRAPKIAKNMNRRVFFSTHLYYSLKYHPYGKLTDSALPLPYHGMETYPYEPRRSPHFGSESYNKYQLTWNTRIHR
ncbi:thrombospondin type 3 repeat-containing protein [Myxococcota bacterium]|nr:thrombospondin type 3 repeat-containing protein [Myxococcota bacterium]MBU1533973.1 thrombospondin type 3 repeat-containing protein [Myxococcota bacterium]